MARWLLVRHGETDWNKESRFQGQANQPLNETGRRQAQAIARRLALEPLAVIYSSDLQRAQETASAIATLRGSTPVILEPRLREISFGDWEGLTYLEIEQRDQLALLAWQADNLMFSPPGGESLMQLAERVGRAYETIRQAYPGEATVLVVAHGGPLQVLICLALGLPPQMYWQFQMAPASLSVINLYPQGAIVNLLNDTSHHFS